MIVSDLLQDRKAPSAERVSSIQLKSGLEWLGHRPLRLFRVFRLTFLFMALYFLNMLIYVHVLKTANPPAVDQMLTAAFSPTENFYGYSSATEGLLFNLELELVIIATTEFYERIARGERRWFDLTDIVFLLGILASYVMSVLLYLTRGFPSSGTSIIGVCVSLSLFARAVPDSLREMAVAFHAKTRAPPASLLVSYAMGVLSVVYLGGFLVANAGVHLLGLLVFLPLFALSGALRRVRMGEVSSMAKVYLALAAFVVLVVGFQTISQLFRVAIG